MKVPGFLRFIWRHWRALAVKIGHFNGLVLLTVLYWTVIGIVGGIFQLFKADPLGRRTAAGSSYHKKELDQTELTRYEHLY